MNKVTKRLLAIVMSAVMLLTAIPILASATDETPVEAPVFTISKVSETPTTLVLMFSLKSSSFTCFDLKLSVDDLTCTEIILTDAFYEYIKDMKKAGGQESDAAYAATNKLSISATTGPEAPIDVAQFTYTKPEKTIKGVVQGDITASFETCYVDDTSGTSTDEKGINVTDKVTVENLIPAVHTHVSDNNWVTTLDPTCGTLGSKETKCTECGGVAETDSIEKLPHAKDKYQETTQNPTCTQDGFHKIVCGDCKTEILNETLYATNHAHTHNEDLAATCTTAGYHKVYCEDCEKYIVNQTLDATGHLHTHNEDLDPTCTVAGYHKVYCDDCKQYITNETIDATGHVHTRNVNVAVTCTTDGYSGIYCDDCKTLIKEDTHTAHKGHMYVPMVVKATCHNAGYYERECSVCHDKVDHVDYQQLEHKWTSWAVIQESTYRSYGVKRRTCTLCGDFEEELLPLVKVNVTEVVLSMESISMYYKKTTKLYADVLPEEAAFSNDIIWSTSNPKVATVDENGLVTATGSGTAIITASTEDGTFSDDCSVTVSYSWLQKIIIYVLFGWIWY